MTDGAGGAQGSSESDLAEPIRPGLFVELSMDPDDPDQELRVRYADPGLRNPSPRDPGYWDQVIDLQ